MSELKPKELTMKISHQQIINRLNAINEHLQAGSYSNGQIGAMIVNLQKDIEKADK